MDRPITQWRDAARALRHLSLMRSLLETPPLAALLRAADDTSAHQGGAFPASAVAEMLHHLAEEGDVWCSSDLSKAADPFEAWLIHAVLRHDHAFARLHEQRKEPGPLLSAMFRSDLALLDGVRHVLHGGEHLFALPTHWQSSERREPYPSAASRAVIVHALSDRSQRWAELSDRLAHFFRSAGAGPFNDAVGYIWQPGATDVFRPVRRLDPVRLENLVGYEAERAQVTANTQRLVAGLPAHNLLLYGDRGTGKSATVKALAHAYEDQGLRIIQVSKEALHGFPQLASVLAGRGLKFILFVDDLSFEGAESEYKELKAFLEGSLQAPAANARVYATSNRRHLVREQFSEREDDVRSRDTVEEKLSLADRFGITIVFMAPKERQYLEIVRELVRQSGVDVPDDVVARKALQWATWQNGISGRTARHFVDSLIQDASEGEA